MNELDKRKESLKFSEWKHETIKKITPMIVKFFSNKFSQDDAKRLGLIIYNLNNPYYDVLDYRGDRLSITDIMALRILLEIMVEEFIENNKE